MDPLTAIGLGSSALGLIGGFFSGDAENPNEWAWEKAKMYDSQATAWLNPDYWFYKDARKNFLKDTTTAMGALTPSANSLLASTGLRQGGSYGGSVLQSNYLRRDMNRKGRDTVGQSYNRFGQSLYQTGLQQYQGLKQLGAQMFNLYGQGALQAGDQNAANRASYWNSVTGMGLGILGEYGFPGENPNQSMLSGINNQGGSGYGMGPYGPRR